MIDGFRYALTGYSDSSIGIGMLILIGFNIILFFAIYYMLKTGYRIKN